MEPEDRADFLEDLGLEEPGLNKLARAAYSLLGLQTYFTAGPEEIEPGPYPWAPRPSSCWRDPHDFERGFIRANVYSIPDLQEHKTEAGLKAPSPAG